MKKILSFVLLFVLVFGLVACGSETIEKDSGKEKNDYIAVNLSNCNYYLSIDDSYITSSSVRVSAGTFTTITRKITINGAVSGIYSDCTITFEYGENKTNIDIQLNAAGFASFEYKINNSSYTAKIVSCTGKLYI